jgi:anti-anti-sigma factor
MTTAPISENLRIEVRHSDRGVTVRLGGAFDALSVGAFSAAVGPLLYERRQPRIELELRGLRHLSGSGLGAIVFAVQFANGHGQSCHVTAASGQPEAILRTVELTRTALRRGAVGTVN